MTHTVTEACIKCKYTDCVDVCIPECPVNAIYAEVDVPADQQHMTALNAELARLPTWKSITKRKDPLPDADEWADKTDKLSELVR